MNEELVNKVRDIVTRAQKALGEDLGGFSKLDLVADNLPGYPLVELREALKRAGF